MNAENGHEHDTHYHGEPSRVLDDQPLPEAVVFYESGIVPLENTVDANSEQRIERWLNQLKDQGSVKRAFVVSDRGVTAPDGLAVHTLDRSELDPFDETFQGFPESLFEEPGLLFIPATLSVSGGAWSDLKSNDVSVNWLSVLPDPPDEKGLPRLIVLSDWITRIDSDVPKVRSTGVTPGIFYVKSESLEVFSDLSQSVSSLEEGLQALLDRDGEKIRPAFLRGREWSFGENS